MRLGSHRLALAAGLLALAAPAVAGNTVIPAGQRVAVAKSAMTVAPNHEWNKLGARPGRNSEEWTLDGDGLNDLTFYGGIENDRTLFREISKRSKPLPRFSSTMLLTDVPTLLEQSYRIALDTPLMSIEGIEPATLSGNKAVRFRYSFTRQNEEVKRNGEAVAAIVGGKLYMVTYEAPTIFYFDRDAAGYRAVVDSVRIG
jgi:hypothetical protein